MYAERMMKLFAGFEGAHGTHGSYEQNQSKNGKLEIKKSARTIREPVTVDLWKQHLAGTRALGIIPVNEKAECVWGCIDVDRYDINHAAVVKELKNKNLPLIVCRTKSGGLHAFLFLKKPDTAENVRVVLKRMAALMGWGDSEIFPKQNKILAEKGDLGSWLNMPYFGGDKSDRYAVKDTMAGYSLGEFLDMAEKSRITLDDVPSTNENEFSRDAPPCLEHLASMGFPEGTRNNGLFALGIYAKKKWPDDWRKHLERMNRDYMTPPLSSDEVLGVVKGLEKKDYNYTCREQPLCSHCESSLCRTRKFGVTPSGSYPEITGLSKLESEPPIWFLDIEEQRLQLTTKELQNYREFQHVCMEKLTVFYMPIKTETWVQIVGTAMKNAVIIEAPEDMSISGHFMELLEQFCTDRHRATRWEEIHQGRPFHDEETGRYYFRLRDLENHLKKSDFRHWGRNEIGNKLKEIGEYGFKKIDGKGVNLFNIDEELINGDPTSKLPKSEGNPI